MFAMSAAVNTRTRTTKPAVLKWRILFPFVILLQVFQVKAGRSSYFRRSATNDLSSAIAHGTAAAAWSLSPIRPSSASRIAGSHPTR